ncbi:hypothetical protein BKA67DRAFT_565544 [Truncatella angustata]|uniref:C2H2-type domain-containing protein n=1 Tax=Truncatella angustata TaxID=152316 RepID=A0A9P8UM90_9PEZI|nr:uncharacterized protein BKA67DRAFT_565544 [Truncatella angustata]KAH6654555.1 hypothetical protein BKA67DRAFT_565544 [Truncatella angustata]KAH8203396.1 hypothetical protein TruAng_002491 [Truncatella angustata]
MKRMTPESEEYPPAQVKRSRRLAQSTLKETQLVDEVYPDLDDGDDAKDSDVSTFAHDDDHDDDRDDDDADNVSAAGSATTPLTPMSGMSPRKKFPSDLKTIKCTWSGCEKAFNRPARLTAHLRSHTNERPFKCPHDGCDKSYLEEKHLKQHLGGSHSTERKHICEEPDCGKSFLTSTRLRRHQLVHEGQERFRCRDFPPCNQSFRKHQTLQRHIRAEHLKVPAFQCKHEGCIAGFDTASSLRRHTEKEHADIKFWCEECNKDLEDNATNRTGFPTMEQLQQHMKKSHISCTFCDLIFPSRDDMESHTELEHASLVQDGRKNVLCTRDNCGKVFSKQSNLQAHIKSFHDGYRFVCGEFDVTSAKDPKIANWPLSDGCKGGFATKASLEKHIRHVHLDVPRADPPARLSHQPSAPQDMLGQLTNTNEMARRTICCSWFGCPLKFVQQLEMQNHLQTHFDLNLGATLAQDFSMPNVPAIPNVPDVSFLNFEMASPFHSQHSPFSSQPVTPGLGEEWGYSAPATPHVPDYFPEAEQEWQHDEMEMRQLIEPNDLNGLLDPALRHAGM